MNILCRIFGHKPPSYHKRGWYSPGERYMDVYGSSCDGINRWHLFMVAKCPRCNQEYEVGNVHIPKRIIDEYDRKIERLQDEIKHLNEYNGYMQL